MIDYGERSNGKEHGVVLTKPEVVEKMLDLVGYQSNIDLRRLTVIEPSAGEGAFAIPIMRRLFESSLKFDFDFTNALNNLKFYDIDASSLEVLKDRAINEFNALSREHMDRIVVCSDFLTSTPNPCSLVIGNPPYVRHENIPVEQKSTYKRLYSTFTHRGDLYIPFYEKGLQLLNANGKLSFICANRWLKNQYGNQLRKLIARQFQLDYVLDLEKVDAFEEEVIAYPAITTISRDSSNRKIPYYQLDDLKSLLSFSEIDSPERHLADNPSNWFAREYKYDDEIVPLGSIVEQGFKVGIGVATGKDKVFVRKDLNELVERDVLLPMLTSRDVRGSQIDWHGNYFLNPYSSSGELIDLDTYPKTKNYLLEHRDLLINRHVSKKNPKNWYRTIDRVHSALTSAPKIILPDITGNVLIHVDKGEFYPHHNLYYITGKELPELELLAAILMSDFVREQLAEMGNKMNGGYPRWQSQNIKKLRIPFLDSIPKAEKAEIRRAYKEHDIDRINELVCLPKFANRERTEGQLAFFEPKEMYETN